MEPWIIIVLALVAIGGAVWYFNKDCLLYTSDAADE